MYLKLSGSFLASIPLSTGLISEIEIRLRSSINNPMLPIGEL